MQISYLYNQTAIKQNLTFLENDTKSIVQYYDLTYFL